MKLVAIFLAAGTLIFTGALTDTAGLIFIGCAIAIGGVLQIRV